MDTTFAGSRTIGHCVPLRPRKKEEETKFATVPNAKSGSHFKDTFKTLRQPLG